VWGVVPDVKEPAIKDHRAMSDSKQRHRFRRPSPAACIAVAALVVALGGAAYASIPSADGTIKGCYAKSAGGLLGDAHSKGDLRVVDPSEACRSYESALTWNQSRTSDGARAYVSVDGEGNILPGKVKNVLSVSHDEVGTYCVTLVPSIPAQSTAPVATINFENFGDIDQIVAKANAADCPNGIEVQTRLAITSETTEPVAIHVTDVPFSLAVP
jgi:hypothetical protein